MQNLLGLKGTVELTSQIIKGKVMYRKSIGVIVLLQALLAPSAAVVGAAELDVLQRLKPTFENYEVQADAVLLGHFISLEPNALSAEGNLSGFDHHLSYEFSVTRVYKGDAISGGTALISLQDQVIAYEDWSVSREVVTNFKKEFDAKALLKLGQEFEEYRKAFDEGRLSRGLLSELESVYSQASARITERHPFNRVFPRDRPMPLITEGQEYMLFLSESVQPSPASSSFTLLPGNRGVYSDLDLVMVKKYFEDKDSVVP